TRGELTITAPWGWPAIPTAVVLATQLQASRLLTRRDSPYGVAGSPQDGSEMRLLARVDPDVEVVLRPYVRHWWAA
ncbi:phage gp6-like head-tail connector protein, partial [Salinispora arenicola]|nr:phage gp6-like head-tail connector protein [Salinispora arenicola]